MKKLRILIPIVVAALIIAALVGVFYLERESIEPKMFEELSEFSKLEQIAARELAAEKDVHVQGLSAEQTLLCEVDYEGHSYEVYAYVFADAEKAQQYFENVTGKKTQEAWNFSCSGNVFFSTRYVIYSGNCAYLVKGGAYRPTAQFIRWLSADFSQELNFKT